MEMNTDLEMVRTHCLSLPSVTEDEPFGEGFVTYRIAGKIFCCLALVLGQVVQLKCSPDQFAEVTDRLPYTKQAWHWHRRHMLQFDLGESVVPWEEARELIDMAYAYVRSRLPRKVQATLQ